MGGCVGGPERGKGCGSGLKTGGEERTQVRGFGWGCGRLVPAAATLLLVGQEGHQGDIGECLLFEGGPGKPRGGHGVVIGTKKLIAEGAGHRRGQASGFGGAEP